MCLMYLFLNKFVQRDAGQVASQRMSVTSQNFSSDFALRCAGAWHGDIKISYHAYNN